MENDTDLIPQLQQMLKSGCPNNHKLAVEISKSLGLFKKMMKPWRKLWKLKNGDSMPDCSTLSILLRTEYLDLSSRNLKEIPEAVFYLPELRFLNLSNNKISQIPSVLSEMQYLFHLNLNNNRLNMLPNTVCSMNSLKELYLGGNRLQSLDKLSPTIEFLNISANKFKSTPLALLKEHNLHSLDITDNMVKCWNLHQLNFDKLYYLHAEDHNTNIILTKNMFKVYDDKNQYYRLMDKKFIGKGLFGFPFGMNLNTSMVYNWHVRDDFFEGYIAFNDFNKHWAKIFGLEKYEIIQEHFLKNREIRKFFS